MILQNILNALPHEFTQHRPAKTHIHTEAHRSPPQTQPNKAYHSIITNKQASIHTYKHTYMQSYNHTYIHSFIHTL